MSDIDYFDNQYSKEVEALAILVKDVQANAGSTSKRKAVKEKLDNIAEVRRSFGYELRQVKDKELRETFSLRVKDYNGRTRILTDSFEAAVAAHGRAGLFGLGAQESGDPAAGKSNSQLLNDAEDIQDKTEAGLNRIDATVASAKEIALRTLEAQEDQTNQAKNLVSELDSFDARIKAAARYVYQFSSGLLNDNIFRFFMVVNTVLLVAIIVYVLKIRGMIE